MLKRALPLVLLFSLLLSAGQTVSAATGDTPAEAEALTLDTPVTVNLGEDGAYWFSFTPDTTANYSFILNAADDTDFDLDFHLSLEDANNEEEYVGTYDVRYPEGLTTDLNASQTYYLELYHCCDAFGDVTIEVIEAADLTFTYFDRLLTEELSWDFYNFENYTGEDLVQQNYTLTEDVTETVFTTSGNVISPYTSIYQSADSNGYGSILDNGLSYMEDRTELLDIYFLYFVLHPLSISDGTSDLSGTDAIANAPFLSSLFNLANFTVENNILMFEYADDADINDTSSYYLEIDLLSGAMLYYEYEYYYLDGGDEDYDYFEISANFDVFEEETSTETTTSTTESSNQTTETTEETDEPAGPAFSPLIVAGGIGAVVVLGGVGMYFRRN